MQLIPALDVRGQAVVRGVGGNRASYAPLVSRLTISTEPLCVAQAIRAEFGSNCIYIADLDAIERADRGLTGDQLQRFRNAGFSVWLDAGIRDAADAMRLAESVDQVVVGSETFCGLAAWCEIIHNLGPDRVVFSLDLRAGQLMCRPGAWDTLDPLAVAAKIVGCGCEKMIVLDVARIGVGRGIGAETLCRELVRRHSSLALYAGGGIRNWHDVQQLESIGLAGALIATALHDGGLQFASGH